MSKGVFKLVSWQEIKFKWGLNRIRSFHLVFSLRHEYFVLMLVACKSKRSQNMSYKPSCSELITGESINHRAWWRSSKNHFGWTLLVDDRFPGKFRCPISTSYFWERDRRRKVRKIFLGVLYLPSSAFSDKFGHSSFSVSSQSFASMIISCCISKDRIPGSSGGFKCCWFSYT